MRFGEGPLQGWAVELGDQPERTARGALLQLFRLQEAEDLDAQWRLLDHRPSPGAPPLVVRLCEALLDLHRELGEREDNRAIALPDVAAYPLIHMESFHASHLGAAIATAEEALGPASVEEWHETPPRVVATWPTGEVLAFERHPTDAIRWRDCSEEVAAELDAEAPLLEPTPGLVGAMQERLDNPLVVVDVPANGPAVCRVPTQEEREAFAREEPGFVAPMPPLPDRYQDNPPTPREKLQSEFDDALDWIADHNEAAPGAGAPPSPSPAPGATAEAEAAAHRTLAAAEAAAGGDTVWHRLGREPLEPTPVGAWCCSCARSIEGRAHKHQQEGGYVSWAHPGCVRRELDAIGARPAPAPAPAPRPVDRELELALGAEHLKPFRAKHRSEDNAPCCEICLKPIRRGELARRKSKTSSKRLHDACVRDELQKQRKVAS